MQSTFFGKKSSNALNHPTALKGIRSMASFSHWPVIVKIPSASVNQITFHRVHRLGAVKNDRPRPIIAKFEHFKHKELVKKRGIDLTGTNFGMNDQFPKEITDRRKILFPIRKQFRLENKKAVISVDKLYVDGRLYKDREKTPWLF